MDITPLGSRMITKIAKQQGFSLVELTLVLIIVGVLLAVAMPNLSRYIAKARLQTAAQMLLNEVSLVRQQAQYDDNELYFSIVTGNNWCYGRALDNPCDCSTGNSCNFSKVSHSDYENISISAQPSMTQLHFTGDRNFPDGISFADGEQKITLTNSYADSATITIAGTGRVEMCSSQLSGFPAC